MKIVSLFVSSQIHVGITSEKYAHLSSFFSPPKRESMSDYILVKGRLHKRKMSAGLDHAVTRGKYDSVCISSRNGEKKKKITRLKLLGPFQVSH